MNNADMVCQRDMPNDGLMASSGNKRRRVGKIELLRFLFGISIVCFHLNGPIFGHFVILRETQAFGITFFRHASQSVEFFFLVSGYLMAASIDRRLKALADKGADPDECIPQDTVSFVLHKVKPLIPYMVLYATPMLVIHAFEDGKFDPTWYALRLPSLVFLEKTGINDVTVLGTDWYISTMLLAMAVLYPLCRRYKDMFTHVIAPVAGLVGIGFLMQRDGALGSGTLLGITHKCNIRGIAEVSLGCASYAAAKWLRGQDLSRRTRAVLGAAELVAYVLCFTYLCTDLPTTLDGTYVLLLVLAITLSFAQCGLLGHSVIFENKICDYLGALSLPIYLNQYFVIHTLSFVLPKMRGRYHCAIVMVTCLFVAVVSLALVNKFNRFRTEKRS